MAGNMQTLRDLLSDIARQQDYKDATINIDAISSGGGNYTALLYKITISAPDKKELDLFAKIINVTEKTRQFVPTFAFEAEIFMYRDLADIFKRIEQTAEVPEEHRYVFPKVYGYNTNLYEETIVFENLAVQGYEVYDRMQSVDWPYASKAVETLATFHALAMAYEEQNPEEYNKLLKKLSKQIELPYKQISDNFNDFVATAVSATKEENREKLQKYFDRIIAKDSNVFRFAKPKRKAVLIHHDFRPSNILHKINKDGSMHLIPLDYQTIQGGCAQADLLFFIFGASDAQFRAQYYQRLIDHYYDSLSQALKRLRLDPEKIYSREDFDYDLQEALPFGLVCALFVLPVGTLASEDAPDINDADPCESLARPKISSLYSERLNGIVDDYVRWGLL